MNMKSSTTTESTHSRDIRQSVAENVAKSLRDLSRIQANLTGIARDAISGTSSGTPAVADDALETETADEIVKGAIHAARGTDFVVFLCLRSICEGVVVGVNDVRGDFSLVGRQMVALAVEEGAAIGMDAGMMT